MKPDRSTFPLLALALLLGTTSCLSLPQIDAQGRYGKLEADGDLGISTSGVNARANMDEMGLGDDEDVYGGRVDFKWGMPHLVVMGQYSEHKGDGTANAELSQGGVTIPVGADVDSKLDLGLYSGVLLFDLLPGHFWEVAVGFGAAAIDFDARVTDVNTNLAVSSDETFFTPLVAGLVGVEIWRIEASVLLQGFTLEVDSAASEGTYYDVDAMLRFKLLGGDRHLRASIVGGYRYIHIDAEYDDGSDDVDVDVDLKGPYVGLEVTL